ncbi:hypothetical protein MAPG_03298 [Magnaporthiopsis poae ATCC 64411]|uniref:Uncharacterized protein n=1 Tax=Magnaporthiopsis poae (strain ATCC 64411 / 73-15) TaxID=644358 RepID=A0A0C4DTM7_MAGP6|nr:hypothetical protein MAPG_03298 [Magnaporthiopsis poae ATCC 64411]
MVRLSKQGSSLHACHRDAEPGFIPLPHCFEGGVRKQLRCHWAERGCEEKKREGKRERERQRECGCVVRVCVCVWQRPPHPLPLPPKQASQCFAVVGFASLDLGRMGIRICGYANPSSLYVCEAKITNQDPKGN